MHHVKEDRCLLPADSQACHCVVTLAWVMAQSTLVQLSSVFTVALSFITSLISGRLKRIRNCQNVSTVHFCFVVNMFFRRTKDLGLIEWVVLIEFKIHKKLSYESMKDYL